MFFPFSQSGVKSLSQKMSDWGVCLLGIYLVIAFLTPILINLGLIPDGQFGLDSPIFAPPSLEHFCGTDRLGRDVCSRTLQGTSVALQVVFLAVGLAVLIGLPIGILSGYIGGFFDKALVLIMETLYTVPVLLLSVVIAFLLGRGIPNASIALCVVYIPQYFRVVRNQTAQVKTEQYVEAAKAMGAGPLWIMKRYLFKNVITSVPVLLTLNAADAVLILGSLGFLGLGLPETIPEWGSDLNMALDAMPLGIWWTALYPGIAMFGLVLSLSLVGESLELFFNHKKTVQK
ncbi:ABC transporter permease [Prochlorococcus marinus]|uniref:ABC transporter permease n=1 Tax=Prochlorococcus marinus TaxID=1219 RepID=UPI0022B393CA|nr:ABC transporter permease [Prochlorococcus marinus]